MQDKGLRIKLAKDDNGEVGGMIQYVPIENSFVEGKDLYFTTCIWVHGHKQGRGNFQKKGMGKAFIQADELDAKAKWIKQKKKPEMIPEQVTVKAFKNGWYPA